VVADQVRAAARQAPLRAARHLHHVVGDEAVPAQDEVQGHLALSDAALSGNEYADAEDVHENAVQRGPGRERRLQPVRGPGEKRGRFELARKERDAGLIGFGKKISGNI